MHDQASLGLHYASSGLSLISGMDAYSQQAQVSEQEGALSICPTACSARPGLFSISTDIWQAKQGAPCPF